MLEVRKAVRVQYGKHVIVSTDEGGILLDITGPQLGIQGRAGLDAEQATDVALALLAAARLEKSGE